MNVLIIDDDSEWIRKISDLIVVLGHQPIPAFGWKDGLYSLRKGEIGAIILDLHLGNSVEDGFFLLSLMREEGLSVPTMIISFSADIVGVTGHCYSYPFVSEVIPKTRFVEFSFPFQRFFRRGKESEGEIVPKYSSVFVIHGRNIPHRDRVIGVLNELRVIPIYLEREATTGLTIIELVENFTEVNYAVGIMSADDVGALAGSPGLARRARQNVIFEIGFLMGRLGRNRVMVLREDIEMPSNLEGLRWIDLSSPKPQIKTALIRDFQRLKDIDFQV